MSDDRDRWIAWVIYACVAVIGGALGVLGVSVARYVSETWG